MSQTTTAPGVNTDDLRARVQDMYQRVATEPEGKYHFEMGRILVERLGYAPADLDAIPAEAIESFAGVGYYFDLADIQPGETVLDLGSGSGMDAFLAARRTGPSGRVIGIDMTEAQLRKAEALRDGTDLRNTEFRRGYLESLPVEDESIDVVISNGVINLCADKEQVFREIHRVLRPGGRLAIADIVTREQLPESVTCNATLWAACIGGAAQQNAYLETISGAGFEPVEVRDNTAYRFLSRSAQGASDKYGVKSVSLLAHR